MGTIVAPTYATLVMGFLEIKLYNTIEIRISISYRSFFEENWVRFLDDCYFPTNTNIIKPGELLKILNSLNPSIQFTMDVSPIKTAFLDIMINKDSNNDLWMNVYQKPTDSRRYVPFNSCHPKHTLSNIPYCLARRICTIVEKDEPKQKELQDLKTCLKTQGYPDKIITKGIEKAKDALQSDLRKPKPKTDRKILPFVHTNNPNNPNIFKIIKTSIDTLSTSSKSSEIFKSYNLINSTKQPQNLERLLCKSQYIEEDKIAIKKCGKNCACCPYVGEAKSISFKNRSKPFIIKSPFNCDSTNFVYLLTCAGCSAEYIGQTSRTLRERVGLYQNRIKDEQNGTIYVEKHVRTCGKGLFKIFPFFQMRSVNLEKRLGHESAFIEQLKPTLNRKD